MLMDFLRFFCAAFMVHMGICFTITNEDPVLPVQELLDDKSFIRYFPNKEKLVINCPDGTFLDKESLICEFYNAVGNHKHSLTVKYNTIIAEDDGDDVFTCIPGVSRTVLPMKENCRLFNLCGDNGSHIRRCSKNLLFSVKSSTCDYYYQAGCCEFPAMNSSRMVPNSL